MACDATSSVPSVPTLILLLCSTHLLNHTASCSFNSGVFPTSGPLYLQFPQLNHHFWIPCSPVSSLSPHLQMSPALSHLSWPPCLKLWRPPTPPTPTSPHPSAPSLIHFSPEHLGPTDIHLVSFLLECNLHVSTDFPLLFTVGFPGTTVWSVVSAQ